MQKEIIILDPRSKNPSFEELMYILTPLNEIQQTIQVQLGVSLYDLSIQKIVSYEIVDSNKKIPLAQPSLAPDCLQSIQSKRLLHLEIQENIMDIEGMYNQQREWSKTIAFFPLAFGAYKYTDTYKELIHRFIELDPNNDRKKIKDVAFNRLWKGFTDIINLAIDAAENFSNVQLNKNEQVYLKIYSNMVEEVLSDPSFNSYLDPLTVNKKEFRLPVSLGQLNDMAEELFTIEIFKDVNMSVLTQEEVEALTPLELESYEYIRKIDANPDTLPKAKTLSYIRHLYQFDKEQAKTYAEGYTKMYVRKNPLPGELDSPENKKTIQDSFARLIDARREKATLETKQKKAKKALDIRTMISKVNRELDDRFASSVSDRSLIENKRNEVADRSRAEYMVTQKYLEEDTVDGGKKNVLSKTPDLSKPRCGSYSEMIAKYFKTIFTDLPAVIDHLNISDVTTQLIVATLAKSPKKLTKNEIIDAVRLGLNTLHAIDEESYANQREMRLFNVLVSTGFTILDNLTKFEVPKDYAISTSPLQVILNKYIDENDNITYQLAPEFQERILIETFKAGSVFLLGRIKVTNIERAISRREREGSPMTDEEKEALISEQMLQIEGKKKMKDAQDEFRKNFWDQQDVVFLRQKLMDFQLLSTSLGGGTKKKIIKKKKAFDKIESILFESGSNAIPADVRVIVPSNYTKLQPTDASEPRLHLRAINLANEGFIERLFSCIDILQGTTGRATYKDIIQDRTWLSVSDFDFEARVKDILDILAEKHFIDDTTIVVSQGNGKDDKTEISYSISKEYNEDDILDIVDEIKEVIVQKEKTNLYKKLIAKQRVNRIFRFLSGAPYNNFGANIERLGRGTEIEVSDLRLILYVLVAAGYVKILSSAISTRPTSFLDAAYVLTTKGRDIIERSEKSHGDYYMYSRQPELIPDTELIFASDIMFMQSAGGNVNSIAIADNDSHPSWEKYKTLTQEDKALFDSIRFGVWDREIIRLRRNIPKEKIRREVEKTIKEYAIDSVNEDESSAGYRKVLEAQSDLDVQYKDNPDSIEYVSKLNKVITRIVNEEIKRIKEDPTISEEIRTLVVDGLFLESLNEIRYDVDKKILARFYEIKANSIASGEHFKDLVDEIFSSNGGVEDRTAIDEVISPELVYIIFESLKKSNTLFDGIVPKIQKMGLTLKSIYDSYNDTEEVSTFYAVDDKIERMIASDYNLTIKMPQLLIDAQKYVDEIGGGGIKKGMTAEEIVAERTRLVQAGVLNEKGTDVIRMSNDQIQKRAENVSKVSQLLNHNNQIMFLKMKSGETSNSEEAASIKTMLDEITQLLKITPSAVLQYCKRASINRLCNQLGITLESLVFGLVAKGFVAHKTYKKEATYPYGFNVFDIQKQAQLLDPEYKKAVTDASLASKFEEYMKLQSQLDAKTIESEKIRMDEYRELSSINKKFIAELEKIEKKIAGVKKGQDPDTGIIVKGWFLQNLSLSDYEMKLGLAQRELESLTIRIAVKKEGLSTAKNILKEEKAIQSSEEKKARLQSTDIPQIQANINNLNDVLKQPLDKLNKQIEALQKQQTKEKEAIIKKNKKQREQYELLRNEISQMTSQLNNLERDANTYRSIQSINLVYNKPKDLLIYVLLALENIGMVKMVNSAIGDFGKTNIYFQLTGKGKERWGQAMKISDIAKGIIKELKSDNRTLVCIADQIHDLMFSEKFAKNISIEQRKKTRMVSKLIKTLDKKNKKKAEPRKPKEMKVITTLVNKSVNTIVANATTTPNTSSKGRMINVSIPIEDQIFIPESSPKKKEPVEPTPTPSTKQAMPRLTSDKRRR